MNTMWLYAFLALLPALLQAKDPPDTKWAVFQWIGGGIYQMLLAIKAYKSQNAASPQTITTNM